MRGRLIVAAGLVLGATPALAQTALDGIWALTPDQCGTFDPGVMVVDTTEGYVEFYESSCTIAGWAPIGTQELAWNVALECSGEGMSWVRKSIFALDAPFDAAPLRLVEIELADGFVIGRYGCSSPER